MSSDAEDVFRLVATSAGAIVLILIILPQAATLLRIAQNGFEENQLELYNLTVVSKRVEFERGLISPKKTYILILSDGKLYRVNREVFEMYQTGDMISIELKNGKLVFS